VSRDSYRPVARGRRSRAGARRRGILSRVARVALLPRVELSTKADGSFRFAIVADTHGKPHAATYERLRELEPDAILHAGDIGDLSILSHLAEVAPVHAVRGNIDAQVREVPETLLIELRHEQALRLRVLLTHIAVYGPKLRAEVARRATSERASLVVCGHSHVPFIGRDRGLSIFNPGSIGPKRFQLPIVLGALDVRGSQASLRHIDCETGHEWSPPPFGH
jgi:putative phosphoesterase